MQKENRLRKLTKFLIIVPILVILIILGIIASKKSNVTDLAKTDREEIKAIISADGKWEYDVRNSVNKEIRILNYILGENETIDTLNIPSAIDGYIVSSLNTNMLWGNPIKISGTTYKNTIENINIPSTVINVRDGNSFNTSILKNVNVDSNNPNYSSIDGVLYNKDKTDLIFFPNKKTSVNIPTSVTTIGDYAFFDCSSLTNINIPTSVTTIGYNAFDSCSSLTNINIPTSVTTIRGSAFNSCSSLTNINIPSGVKIIEDFVFAHCTKLASVEIPTSVTTIREGAFEDCSSLTSIRIPANVTSISNNAFDERNTNLTIYCYPDTKAHKYAEDNSIKFEFISSLNSISVKENPTKMTYIQSFEDLDLTGGVLELTYQDNCIITKEMTSSGVTTSGFSNSTVGTKPVTISYGGKSTTLNVTVTAKTLTGISVKTPPTKTTYKKDTENLDLTGGVLTLTYNNNNNWTETISMTAAGVTNSGFSNSTVGTVQVTISYGGKSTTLNVTITANQQPEKTLSEISVKTPPTKITYKKDTEDLDLTGGIITLKYDNNTTEEIAMTSSQVNVTGFSNSELGKKTLTVTYGNKTTTFQVEIIENINYQPTPDGNEVIITGGEEGNPNIVIPPEINGKPVTEIGSGAFKDRDDLESVEIPDSVTKIADDAFEGSENTIIICNPDSKAEEFAKEHDMSYIYKGKTITGISVKTPPTKTSYKKNIEKLDLTGGRLTVTYQEAGLTSVLRMTSKGITATGFNNTTVGTKTVTVSYTGKVATFEVTVVEEQEGILLGDITGEGEIDSTDLLLMKRHIIAGTKTEWVLTGDRFTRGDMNSDGVIDSTDLLQLKRKIVNR